MDVPTIMPVLQWLGIAMPTMYAGITLQYSFSTHDIASFGPPKVMARQWLQFYQRGPSWVLPTVLCGTASNAALAALRHAGSGPASSFFLFRSAAAPVYAAAAAAILAIMPLTMLYFEPGINGACKWKIETVLRDEGFNMPEKRAGRPSPLRQSGTMQSRRYAETRTLQELLWEWERINHVRWVIGLAAAMASGWATLCL